MQPAKSDIVKKTAEPQRRDKRFIVVAVIPIVFKKNDGRERVRLWGPFHKREQAAAWAAENLAIPYSVIHSEAP
jgi:hypothetical protein